MGLELIINTIATEYFSKSLYHALITFVLCNVSSRCSVFVLVVLQEYLPASDSLRGRKESVGPFVFSRLPSFLHW